MTKEQKQAQRGLGRAGPVAIVATALPITGACLTLVLGPLAAGWLRQQGPLGVVYFTIAFMIFAALTLAPTYTTSVIAGWTFGFRGGFIAVIVGTVGGATLCYLGARRLAGPRVIETFADHPRWETVRRALAEENALKTLWIVLLLRLSPVLPFGTTNVLLATTGVKFWIYVCGTILGLAPRTALVALAAAGAEQLEFGAGEGWFLLTFGVLATIACIFIFAIAGKRALQRATAVEQLTR